MRPPDPFLEIQRRAARLLGACPVRWSAAAGRTRAGRWVVQLDDGTSAFARASRPPPLPDLMAAEAAAMLDGPDLLHLDVRCDNLSIRGAQAMLVDWNWACRGNGRVDIAGWLSSLHAEGGPAPETILPDEPELAALFSGYWACRAGLPAPQGSADLREVQLRQLRTALPWAARALSLPPPVASEC